MKSWLLALFLAVTAWAIPASAGDVELLNVSYDPTREFYEEYNALFAKHWRQKNGQGVTVAQSHGGSGKQARSILDGLQADVVTLALAHDIDVIAEKGQLLPAGWQSKLPNNSCPYTSTIVFLVRKGNPKNIHDWGDLVRDDVQVIMPNPKTSGGARWNYLAAWGYAKKTWNGDEAKMKGYMKQLFANVPVLDAGARGSTTTFVQRGIGDVLISWESEAFLAEKDVGRGNFEIVAPSISVLAEPPVAVVEKNAARKNTAAAAKEYLSFLYSPAAQALAVKYYYRPSDDATLAKHRDQFPPIEMMTISDFGGWKQVQQKHFDDGGLFDQIYGN